MTKPAIIRTITSIAELDGYREGLRLTGRQPSGEEVVALAEREKHLRRGR